MWGPDVCRGPVDVCRQVKRYGMGTQTPSMSSPSQVEPVPVAVLLVVCVDFSFNVRVPVAGSIMLKSRLCIFLLLIFCSFLPLPSKPFLSGEGRSPFPESTPECAAVE